MRPIQEVLLESITADPALPLDLNVSVVRRIAALTAVVTLLLGCWQLGVGRPLTGFAIVSMSIVMAITFMRIDRETFSMKHLNVLLAVMAMFIILIGIISGRPTPAISLVIPLIPFIAAAIGARRSTLVWLGVSAAMLAGLYVFGKWHVSPYAESLDNFTLIFFIVTCVVATIISLVAYTLMGHRNEVLATLDQANDALQRAVEEARGADAAKTKFLGRMSHELRTPLHAIIGFADVLAQDHKHPLQARQLERIRYVQSSGRRLLELVDEVMEITRNAAPNKFISLQPVLPIAAINEVVEMAQALAAGKSVTIDVDAAAHESTLVLADRKYLIDVISQLVTNAVIYNRTGGQVKIGVAVEDAFVRIDIADTGVGIEAKDLSRVFEPFTQMRQSDVVVDGSGLGLTIAKSLITQMGGQISVTSHPGQGSIFSLLLPRFAAQPQT